MESTIQIELKNLSKKFNKEWIFKDLSITIKPKSKWVIQGNNGSGKSTLIQVISGFLTPDKGSIIFSDYYKSIIKVEDIYNHISYASPYYQLPEELALYEIIEHISLYKSFQNQLTTKEIITLLDLEKSVDKPIKHFSSGMKQRLKLGLAALSDTPILLLDEPTSNLDKNSIDWYKDLIQKYASQKTILVCSNNIKDEYEFCTESVDLNDYKQISVSS